MTKPIPTSEEALFFIKDVQVKLLADDERFQEFKEIMTAFMEGTIAAVIVEPYVKVLLRDEPALIQEFQKFVPINLKQNHVEKNNQEIDFQESEAVNRTNSRADAIRNVDFPEVDVVEKKDTKDNIQEALVYVNRVLNSLKDQPDLISKFFDLMEEYRVDLDQEKLQRSLFVLFKSYPELETEFTQVINIEEPSPRREKAECSRSKKDTLEDIKNRYEDEIFNNEMCISRINSAIDNTVRFLMACPRQKKRVDVTRYLTNENVNEIMQYCNVNLKNCIHPRESAYFVVGKLKVELEVAKEDGLRIVREMASEAQKLQKNKIQKEDDI